MRNYSNDEKDKIASGHLDDVAKQIGVIKERVEAGTAPRQFVNFVNQLATLSGQAQLRLMNEQLQFQALWSFFQRMPPAMDVNAIGFSHRPGRLLLWLGVPENSSRDTLDAALRAERETNKEFYRVGLSIDVEIEPNGDKNSIPFGFTPVQEAAQQNVETTAA
jgi:hypothetical protein